MTSYYQQSDRWDVNLRIAAPGGTNRWPTTGQLKQPPFLTRNVKKTKSSTNSEKFLGAMKAPQNNRRLARLGLKIAIAIAPVITITANAIAELIEAISPQTNRKNRTHEPTHPNENA